MTSISPTDTKTLWRDVLGIIELTVSKAVFRTWFKDTHIVKIEDGVVFVGVPNLFAKDWVSEKHHKTILKCLRDISDTIRSVEYIISTKAPSDTKIQSYIQVSPTNPSDELPLKDLYINKTDNLNPRYTFDSFVVGSFNELAYAAAQAILERPGTRYNPFFVYGQTGHGKTHLIQALGNEIHKKFPDKKVYYVTSERFAQDLVNSIQTNTTSSFKEKYRKFDVLIMDDVQFLSNKEKTQEELFHLFNEIYDKNGQIIFSSDRHPNYIQSIADRLKSRFNAGMTVDIPAPDSESRMAIVKTKAAENNIVLSDEIVSYLSNSMEGNIREIEGALNSIMCQILLKKRDLNIQEIKDVVKNNIKPKKLVAVKDVVKIVAGFYNLDEESIYKKSRKKEVVKPRQVIMYILREDFSLPYPTIGQKLGGRDHTTVIHSYEKIKDELKTDHQLEQEITQLRAML
ncbi:chromosomal replication initiator protein DnaA [Candidatus Campbellbacteria bacterium]|nr:MAG: chromosomal replication initiator protein DnaA [Candidatus Campbellbacteria bacterium]